MPAEHCIRGALRDTRSSPKILGDLKAIVMIKSYGGRRVSRLSPSLIMHSLHECIAASKSSASIEDEEPTNTNQEKIPKTPERGRGWVRTRDVNNPRIHSSVVALKLA